jgi:catechol-2,3-dioxygenase
MAETKVAAPKQLGHIALRVRDIEKAVEFYSEVLGLDVKSPGGRGPAFLGNREDASHELALMRLPADAPDPDPTRVGMYHMAWEMESFEALEGLHNRLIAKGAKIAGYSASQNSANVMFFDPEGNELEALFEPSREEAARIREKLGTFPQLKRAPGFD